MKIKTDLYTKVVLTVIAVVLTLNFVKDVAFVTEVKASVPSSFPAPLAAQTDGVIDVNIVQVNGKDLTTESLKVDVARVGERVIKDTYYKAIPVTVNGSVSTRVDNIVSVDGSVYCK